VLTQGAADYLASSDLKLLGLDTPSPGNDDSNVGLHRALLGAGIALVECLIGVHELPPLVELTCLPLPLVGLDGSPVRALARG
jgi:kynurenine formamidase